MILKNFKKNIDFYYQSYIIPINIKSTNMAEQSKKVYTVPVERNDELGTFITLPDEIIKKLGIEDGDEFEYVQKENGTIILRKVEEKNESS